MCRVLLSAGFFFVVFSFFILGFVYIPRDIVAETA